uniref:EF-hand domain-containing protein n=1 Tax=Lotharella oceanica TaxID=641309 RepID=A0A7S2TRH2_9EUKA
MAGIPGQSFFGLVALGPNDPFSHNLLKNMNMSKFTEEEFEKAFKSIDKDGNGYISIDEVRYLLTSLYSMKNPPEEEVKMFVKFFDKNKDGKITYEEFKEAVPKLKGKVQKETKVNHATTTNSVESLYRVRNKHKRNCRGPQQLYAAPMTTAQEVGWQTASKAEKNKNDPHMPKNSCEETVFASEMIKSGIYY